VNSHDGNEDKDCRDFFGSNRMSRSGYSDDLEPLALGRWRAQVKSAIRGKRGQAFLREMLDALDAIPAKRLIVEDLVNGGEVCALGSVGVKRGIDMKPLDPHDPQRLSSVFGIAHQLVSEIEYENDECGSNETPEQRWQRMRDWVSHQIINHEPEKTS
jgi:hypothetical protein